MKKILIIAPAFLFLLAGCNSLGNRGDNPKAVLNAFFDALSQKNITEAKKLVTEDSKGLISLMELSFNAIGEVEEDSLDQFDKSKIEMGDPIIDGDNATVVVTEKKSGESVNFYLKREKGDWKVAFDMGTLMKMAKDKMGEKLNSDELKDFPEEDLNKLSEAADSLKAILNSIDTNKIKEMKELFDSSLKSIPADKMKDMIDAMEKLQKQ
ncbi:MAG: DUF4878 domain-containing protein [Chitinophagaceae bacterium]|nr:DUF4878 domain-containing protein [Chitinophagaceae bacterium]